MFEKVLIANRGEIALRVLRACRELGVQTVAVHSVVDAEARHVRLADEAVCIGPAEASGSYLNVPAILAAAEITGADAVHPGYGFLSENADFAQICSDCGLTFIGPTPDDMSRWGEKVPARALAKRLGLPLMEGSAVMTDADDAARKAEAVGFPVMLKASGGGGGRGMQIIRNAEAMRKAYPRARSEAEAAFKNGDLYCERYVEEPRHIEFQVLCDGKGKVWVLGERECSIQRRHQKILEEAPSVAMSHEQRMDMTATIERAMKESGYRSAGTLEFLMDEKGDLAFMEMNTRIQVEHPVTEEVTGVDLVMEQIRLAAGDEPTLEDHPTIRGHAIELRINAEDPDSFVPWPGTITSYHPAGGPGIRVDDGVFAGWTVPRVYDSLIAKLIAVGPTREIAIRRLRRAVDETLIEGIRTNLALHRRILQDPDFVAGNLSTRFLERLAERTATG